LLDYTHNLVIIELGNLSFVLINYKNMPVTKTAKRALRSSKKKAQINRVLKSRLEIAIRLAKNKKSEKTVGEAISLTDRAAKRKIFHQNKILLPNLNLYIF